MYSIPVALTPALPSELLTYILSFDARPVTLMVCQPRDRFLQSLLQSTPTISHIPPASPEGSDANAHDTATENPFLRHDLLVPTIQQVLTSRNIDVVFVQSLSHLRAYLAVFHSSKQKDTRYLDDDRCLIKEQSLLMVYGMLELHRDTTEWSAQGLSQTLANIVHTGYHNHLDIMLVEETRQQHNSEDSEAEELSAREIRKLRRQEALHVWDEEVPVLSGGSSKKVVEGGWSGRKVEIGRILKRWFRFEAGLWHPLEKTR